MNRLADARQALYDAIAPALPGRVEPYPLPHLARGTAPMVWIDQSSGSRETVGARGRVIVAYFPIFVIWDGAVHAQVAGVDQTLAAVWDACEAAAGIEPRSWQPRNVNVDTVLAAGQPPPAQLSPAQGPPLRASVLTAAVTILARTFCAPDVEVATIPPELVGAQA